MKQAIAELQDLVRCRCHPAYKDRKLHDPDCECDNAENVKVVADRIEELEAKLAKAVEALGVLIQLAHDCEKELTEELHRQDFCGESLPLTNARATLAELKGEK